MTVKEDVIARESGGVGDEEKKVNYVGVTEGQS